MAAPAKAFIDPTFLYRNSGLSSCFRIYQPVRVSMRPLPAGHQVHKTSESLQIPLFLKPGGDTRKMRIYNRVPTPPMGRLAILTFPSVYKTGGGRPAFGQLYPRTR